MNASLPAWDRIPRLERESTAGKLTGACHHCNQWLLFGVQGSSVNAFRTAFPGILRHFGCSAAPPEQAAKRNR